MESSRVEMDSTIGRIVAADFRTAAVFGKYGIDFCCGGKVALAEVCQARGIEPGAIAQELAAARSAPADRGQNYAAWSLSFLADYIVNTHHVYLRENTGPIAAYAQKIAAVHGAHHPEVVQIAAAFDQIARDLEAHLREEEEVLFPALKRAEAAAKVDGCAGAADRQALQRSLATLFLQHDEIGEAAHRIRHLSKGYAIPDDVCNTFAVTYQKLQEFEDDLHKHVHLENNILFEKASALVPVQQSH